MKHLAHTENNLPSDQILSNWLRASQFIYDGGVSIEDLKTLLIREVTNRNREMVVCRVMARLLNRMKQETYIELEQDIEELIQDKERVREENRALPDRNH